MSSGNYRNTKAIQARPPGQMKHGTGIAMEAESTAGYFLSPQQSHQWLLQQRSETRGSAQIAVLLEGEVDESRLRGALRRVIARHEILRTVFRRQAGMKTPFQVIQEASEPEWGMNLGAVSGPGTEDEE